MKIEDQWEKYIQCIFPKKDITLSDIEYSEMKNAFYAGASSTFLEIIRISSKDTDEFKYCMLNKVNELNDYWNNQTS